MKMKKTLLALTLFLVHLQQT